MSAGAWYVHIQGETFGPVPTDVVSIMLRQHRLQFSDFVWTDGLAKWMRIGELTQFAAYLPPYPSVPIPKAGAQAVPQPSPPPLRAVAGARPPPTASPARRPMAQAAQAAAVAPPPAGSAARPAPRAEAPLKEWIRRYGRVKLAGTALIDGFGDYEIVDISEGGVFLKAPTPIPFGTDLKFRIESERLPKALDMTGIVIREGASEDGQFGFAIQFTRVNPAHRRVIHDYVKAATQA